MRPNGLRQHWQRRRARARLQANGKPRLKRTGLQVAGMKARFLLLYAQTGLMSKSVNALLWPDGTHTSRATIQFWLENDPAFQARFVDAKIAFAESLEEEAHRRAVIGHVKPVFYRGEEVGAVREFSDQLLIALLKANLPEKYRDRVDITLDVKAEIRRMAAELGVDVEIAEAEWAQLEPRLLGKG